MKKCLIIGGGFAGLSSAVYLSNQNYNIRLIEASPKLGGRAYSLANKNNGDIYDNGQHIFMGCYDETLAFLQKIDALENLDIQKSLEINFVKQNGRLFSLKTRPKFYPLNLSLAILNFKAISFKSRLKIIDFFIDLVFCFDDDLKDYSVLDWLKTKKQTEESIKAFWEILVVGALNTTIKSASAEIFARILKRIFLDGPDASKIIVPKSNLNELYVEKSKEYINKFGGEISLSERVLEFVVENNVVKKVITDKAIVEDFDFVITAIPLHALSKIKFSTSSTTENDTIREIWNIEDSLEYSSILNVHLWLNENPFERKFYGLINADVHWLFNHGKFISLITSAAGEIITLENHEILARFYSILENYFPKFNRNFVTDFIVLKEKRATFIPNKQSNYFREKVASHFENFIFAGDWINTGLPSTIESAVLSGKLAAMQLATEK